MLSPPAYARLTKLPDKSLKFFLQLLADLNLHHFHALDSKMLAEHYAISENAMKKHLKVLLGQGILITGPLTTAPRGRGLAACYRVDPRWWLAPEEEWEGNAVLERESLALTESTIVSEPIESWRAVPPPLVRRGDLNGMTHKTSTNKVRPGDLQVPARLRARSSLRGSTSSPNIPGRNSLDYELPENESPETCGASPSLGGDPHAG